MALLSSSRGKPQGRGAIEVWTRWVRRVAFALVFAGLIAQPFTLPPSALASPSSQEKKPTAPFGMGEAGPGAPPASRNTEQGPTSAVASPAAATPDQLNHSGPGPSAALLSAFGTGLPGRPTDPRQADGSGEDSKLDATLNGLVRVERQRGPTAATDELRSRNVTSAGGQVHVLIYHGGPGTAGIQAAIRTAGGTPLNVYEDVASARVPISSGSTPGQLAKCVTSRPPGGSSPFACAARKFW